MDIPSKEIQELLRQISANSLGSLMFNPSNETPSTQSTVSDDKTVKAFAQWLIELESSGISLAEKLSADVNSIEVSTEEHSKSAAELKRWAISGQQYLESQVSDLKQKLAIIFTELAMLSSQKAAVDAELLAELDALNDAVQQRVEELDRMRRSQCEYEQQVHLKIQSVESKLDTTHNTLTDVASRVIILRSTMEQKLDDVKHCIARVNAEAKESSIIATEWSSLSNEIRTIQNIMQEVVYVLGDHESDLSSALASVRKSAEEVTERVKVCTNPLTTLKTDAKQILEQNEIAKLESNFRLEIEESSCDVLHKLAAVKRRVSVQPNNDNILSTAEVKGTLNPNISAGRDSEDIVFQATESQETAIILDSISPMSPSTHRQSSNQNFVNTINNNAAVVSANTNSSPNLTANPMTSNNPAIPANSQNFPNSFNAQNIDATSLPSSNEIHATSNEVAGANDLNANGEARRYIPPYATLLKKQMEFGVLGSLAGINNSTSTPIMTTTSTNGAGGMTTSTPNINTSSSNNNFPGNTKVLPGAQIALMGVTGSYNNGNHNFITLDGLENNVNDGYSSFEHTQVLIPLNNSFNTTSNPKNMTVQNIGAHARNQSITVPQQFPPHMHADHLTQINNNHLVHMSSNAGGAGGHLLSTVPSAGISNVGGQNLAASMTLTNNNFAAHTGIPSLAQSAAAPPAIPNQQNAILANHSQNTINFGQGHPPTPLTIGPDGLMVNGYNPNYNQTSNSVPTTGNNPNHMHTFFSNAGTVLDHNNTLVQYENLQQQQLQNDSNGLVILQPSSVLPSPVGLEVGSLMQNMQHYGNSITSPLTQQQQQQVGNNNNAMVSSVVNNPQQQFHVVESSTSNQRQGQGQVLNNNASQQQQQVVNGHHAISSVSIPQQSFYSLPNQATVTQQPTPNNNYSYVTTITADFNDKSSLINAQKISERNYQTVTPPIQAPSVDSAIIHNNNNNLAEPNNEQSQPPPSHAITGSVVIYEQSNSNLNHAANQNTSLTNGLPTYNQAVSPPPNVFPPRPPVSARGVLPVSARLVSPRPPSAVHLPPPPSVTSNQSNSMHHHASGGKLGLYLPPNTTRMPSPMRTTPTFSSPFSLSSNAHNSGALLEANFNKSPNVVEKVRNGVLPVLMTNGNVSGGNSIINVQPYSHANANQKRDGSLMLSSNSQQGGAMIKAAAVAHHHYG